jgi:hypothetical protein
MEHPAGDPVRPEEVPDPVRRRLDEVFGDVLPEITRDEVSDAADDRPSARDDEWLRVNRPPHHDRG